jgi:thiol-disulfide isomerase/thioredoxin
MAVALIVVVSILTGGSAGNNFLVGTKLPSLTLPSLNSTKSVDAPWNHGKPAVVVFFASWCVDCRPEMPRVAAWVRRHDTGDVEFFGVDANDLEGKGRQFAEHAKVGFPVGFDALGVQTASMFGISQLPDTVFVNRQGVVTDVVTGPVSNAELRQQVALLR